MGMPAFLVCAAIISWFIYNSFLSKSAKDQRLLNKLRGIAEADRDIRALHRLKDAVLNGQPIPEDLPFSKAELAAMVDDIKRRHGT